MKPPPSVRVKICGITNRADAEAAIELGADALGFNLYAGSKRFIELRAAAEWIRELPLLITRVAVMVNPTIAAAEEVFALPFIDAVQFHGHESAEFCAHFAARERPFFKALALRDEHSDFDARRFHTRHIVLDAFAPGQFGGTGRLIDLGLAERFARENPDVELVLSGGLTPANVAEAIGRVQPFAVDVASGVEKSPGRKDRALLRAFLKAAKSAPEKVRAAAVLRQS